MKKIIYVIQVMVMTILMAGLFGGMDVKAETGNGSDGNATSSYSTSAVTLNATNIELYALNDWASEYISVPTSLNQSFQLKANGGAITSCYVSQGDAVQVTSTGLITPAYTTWYWNGNVGSNFPSGQEGERVETRFNFGEATVTVTAGGQTFQVKVNVLDYANTYANQKMDDYIAKNITNSMSVYEKVDKICQFVASYNYSAGYSGATGMIVSGGGDCWASTSTILAMCEKLNITAWARRANRDPGAGSGHMNVMVQDGDVYYQAEAGFSEPAPRYYYVAERDTLFNYYVNGDTASVYQYDGNPEKEFALTIPETLNGYTVTAIGEEFLYGNSKVTAVTIPNTVTSIGKGAFNSCTSLKTLHIPASVTSIGEFAFTNDNALTAFTCSPDNKAYCVVEGVLYNKARTTLLSCPQAASVKIPNTVKSIGDYAFYYNEQISSVTLPNSVVTIGEGAFAHTNISEVLFPNSVTSIGQFALRDTQAKVVCNSNSAAHKYALENEIECILLDKNGLFNDNGTWHYYVKGRVDTGYTGLFNQFGNWWYVDRGAVNLKATGLCRYGNDWYFVQNGAVNFKATGLWNQFGSWWYVQNGKVNFKATGLCQYGSGWYFVQNGAVNFKATGLCQYGSGWYFVQNGAVDFKATGLWNQFGSWWYVQNGAVNFKAAGLWNQFGSWWYVKDGRVDFSYTGTAPYGGREYNVVSGKVVF